MSLFNGKIENRLGLYFLGSSLLLFILIFSPALKQEVKYEVKYQGSVLQSIVPVSSQFGIVIPKIRANSPIIANVNPYNSQEYQQALTHGVAQARGTVFPGEIGNIFLFAHSSQDWYTANRYNAVFYLLHKLQLGDEIFLYYQGKKFVYHVVETKIVTPADVKYLNSSGSRPQVTLMTCWPPGTTWKRFLVIGEL